MITDAMPPLLHCLEQYGDLGLAQEVLATLSWASVVESLLTFRPLGVVLERIGTFPELVERDGHPVFPALRIHHF